MYLSYSGGKVNVYLSYAGTNVNRRITLPIHLSNRDFARLELPPFNMAATGVI